MGSTVIEVQKYVNNYLQSSNQLSRYFPKYSLTCREIATVLWLELYQFVDLLSGKGTNKQIQLQVKNVHIKSIHMLEIQVSNNVTISISVYCILHE